MKTKLSIVCGLIAAILAIALAACDNGTSPGGGGNPSTITWSLSQEGGVAPTGGGAATESTTAIVITFNGSVSLTDADITIGGAATRNSAALIHSGNAWKVPVDVSDSENATVTVTKTGVEGGTKTVMVYKQGEAPVIDWSATTNGTADTTDTSAITFTFGEAVNGLTAGDIILTPVTGSATKGMLTGSGASYVLTVTVTNQGTVSVQINRTGVTTVAKEVTVHKRSVNPVSGRTTYSSQGKIVFSTATGNNGTFTMSEKIWDNTGYPVLDGNGKYTWEPSAEGTYTWNQTAHTITGTLTKMDYFRDGTLRTKAETESMLRTSLQTQVNEWIDGMVQQGITEEEAKETILDYLNEVMGTNHSTLTAALNAYVSMSVDRVAEIFAPRTYTYTFSSNGESLILLESLPEPSGTDELAGKTFYEAIWDDITQQYEQDTDHRYEFLSGTARTYTATHYGNYVITGSYSYNVTRKEVFFKPEIINGETPVQYYDGVDYEEQYNRYPTEADHRTAETSSRFSIGFNEYDAVKLILGWFD